MLLTRRGQARQGQASAKREVHSTVGFCYSILYVSYSANVVQHAVKLWLDRTAEFDDLHMDWMPPSTPEYYIYLSESSETWTL
jgi:hypothetical protein